MMLFLSVFALFFQWDVLHWAYTSFLEVPLLRSSAAPSAPQREAKAPHLEKAEPLVPLLTKEQFERELNYRAVLSIARQMREGGLVTPGEFVQIDRFLRRKFSPVWGGLYQNNP